ncbi:MAG: hypothetical protein C0407_11645 [Desulfobacca sp.]|nr:hypothetical protein [Desulfobacca sp.]
MEKMASMTKTNADNAMQANTRMQETRDGVEGTNQAMTELNESMQLEETDGRPPDRAQIHYLSGNVQSNGKDVRMARDIKRPTPQDALPFNPHQRKPHYSFKENEVLIFLTNPLFATFALLMSAFFIRTGPNGPIFLGGLFD